MGKPRHALAWQLFPHPPHPCGRRSRVCLLRGSCLGWPRWPSSSKLARSSRGGRTEILEAHQGVVSTACQRSLDLRAEAGHWGKKSPKPARNRASCVISPQGRPWPPAGGSDAGWNTKDSRKTATTRTHRVKMSRNSSNWGESRTTPLAKKSALFLEIYPSMAYAQRVCRKCLGATWWREGCWVGGGHKQCLKSTGRWCAQVHGCVLGCMGCARVQCN